ncbi:acetylornithine deacetylase [Pseudalgibacter alginicilyticus]|uniref:Acetylornithine deacetylase n=1 Tax=Pseudalgibacter alginicilyticus TaxID=1736674 RepID=A0A0N7HYB5_9FLAO|nr:acetylornithine deacetylase [Pseudalgibacter alginicilyticus]ALJ04790.1 acetylornithine deacetylase [Pseudalgibacter alginicilyticus]
MNVEQILEKLIAFPVLGGESNLEIIHWIKSYIEKHGIKPTLVPNKTNTKASLHCRIGPEIDGGTILSGHTDVVPVKGQNWDTDPFKLTDKGDGKLYGRGTCDMKGFLACCLAALPAMTKTNLKTPIYLAFSYDEEIGCLAAPELIKHIQSTYSEKPKYAIIGEPSMLQPIIGQKSMHILDITVNGSAGHSSRIKQEVSAVHEAAKLVLWAEQKMTDLIASGNIDNRFNPPHSSLHIGKISGGIAANIIADKATLSMDIRTIPQDNSFNIFQDFITHCKNRENALRTIYPDFEIKIKENHPIVPALNTNTHTEIVSLIAKLTGSQKWSTVSYASEAGQFAQAGFQSIICGPGSIKQAHRANEFITKKQLQKGVAMIQSLINHSKISN